MKHSRYKYISIIVVLTIILTFKTVNSRSLLSRRSRRKASEILGISVFTVNGTFSNQKGLSKETDCKSCPTLKVSNEERTKCQGCPPGKWGDRTVECKPCQQCAVGKHNDGCLDLEAGKCTD